jgi:hypothetical protein
MKKVHLKKITFLLNIKPVQDSVHAGAHERQLPPKTPLRVSLQQSRIQPQQQIPMNFESLVNVIDLDENTEEIEVVGEKQVIKFENDDSISYAVNKTYDYASPIIGLPDESENYNYKHLLKRVSTLPSRLDQYKHEGLSKLNQTTVPILKSIISSNKVSPIKLSTRLEEKLKNTQNIDTVKMMDHYIDAYVSPTRNRIYRKLKEYPRIIDAIMKYLTNEEQANFWSCIKSELGRDVGYYLNELLYIQKYHVTLDDYTCEMHNKYPIDKWNPLAYFYHSVLREFFTMNLMYWSYMLNDFLLEIISSTFDLHINVTSANDSKYLVEFIPTNISNLDQIRVVNLVIIDDIYWPLNAPLSYPILDAQSKQYSQLLQEFLKSTKNSITPNELADALLEEYDIYTAYYFEQFERIVKKSDSGMPKFFSHIPMSLFQSGYLYKVLI